MARRATWLLLAGLLALPGCGHKGPPEPPLPRLPVTPRAAAFRQRGPLLQVRATYQLSTLEGTALKPPVHPVVLHMKPRMAGDVQGWDTPAREREFGRLADPLALPPFTPEQLLQTVERTDGVPVLDLLAVAAGSIPGPPVEPGDPPQPVVLALALRDRPRLSFPSPRVVFRAADPPLAPLAAFEAVPEENGIRLTWTVTRDARVNGVRVFRHRPGEAEPWEPWRRFDAAESGVLDDTARYGDELVYVATAAGPDDLPVVVESAPLAAAPIAYRDVFPPLPPAEVDAVPETGAIRVFWYPGGSKDEAAVVVERQAEGEADFTVRGTVPVPESFFADGAVEPARRYRYRAITVDREGNRAAPVGPTAWVAPRPPEEPAR